jgi:hypothetical protein
LNGISGNGDIRRYVHIRAALAIIHSDGVTSSCDEGGKVQYIEVIPKKPAIIDKAPMVLLLNIFFWKLGTYAISPTAG